MWATTYKLYVTNCVTLGITFDYVAKCYFEFRIYIISEYQMTENEKMTGMAIIYICNIVLHSVTCSYGVLKLLAKISHLIYYDNDI